MRILFLPITLGASLLACASPGAQEWSRFHGSDGRGTSDAKTIPVKLDKADYNWDVKLPGTGHSSPVVWGDQIFLTTTDRSMEGSRSIVCLSTKDGAVVWKKDESFAPTGKHKWNDYAASTPAADAERVYISWSTPEVVLLALDHAGKEVWRKELGPFEAQHGSAMSPVVVDGVVMLGNQMEGGDSFIIAVEAGSGKQLWKLPRTTDEKAAYSTPAIVGGTAIYSSSAHGLTGIDIKSGKVLWEHDPKFGLRCVATPVVAGDLVFASGGDGGGTARRSACASAGRRWRRCSR